MSYYHYHKLEGPECPLCGSTRTKDDPALHRYYVCLDCRARFTCSDSEDEEKSIETMNVEQFMDAIKAILHGHGVEAPEDVDDMLVDLYNSYRECVHDGKTWEESEHFLMGAVKEIILVLKLEEAER